MKHALQQTLTFYREKYRECRESGDVDSARIFGLIMTRIQQDLGDVPEVPAPRQRLRGPVLVDVSLPGEPYQTVCDGE